MFSLHDASAFVSDRKLAREERNAHHDLETVEAARLGSLHLARESLDKVLVHDTIGGGEEGEDVGDEVAAERERRISDCLRTRRGATTTYRSLSLSLLSQSCMSLERSISSAVQKEASAFLYICQI